MENVLAGTILIGFVNISQMAIDRKWDSLIKAMTALIAGALFGYLKFFGIPSVEMGIAIGISSSGVYKLFSQLKPELGQPNL